MEWSHMDLPSEHGSGVSAALHFAIIGIELTGAAIIVIAALIAVLQLLKDLILRGNSANGTSVRFTLGQRLVMALEFLIAADILKTVLSPTLQDLLVLGGTILIRTLLSLSIAYELKSLAISNNKSSSTTA